LLSNYASYFIFHFIIPCKFFHFFIEQKLLEDNYEEIFSLFTTLHDIVVLQIVCILQVDFFPTCLQVRSFDSQQDGYIHESQYVLETTSSLVHSINFYLKK